MSWLIFALGSYLLSAFVAVMDKFLIIHKARSPAVYAFYVGVLNFVAFALWPFDFSILSPRITLVAFMAGVSFFLAFFFLYSAMTKGEISRLISVVGGITPIFVLLLSYFFLEERLPAFWLLGFFLLIFGSLFLSWGGFWRNGTKAEKKMPFYSFAAAVFFALTFFFTKMVFLESSFINGFVWTRTGTLAAALFLLLLPSFRSALKSNSFGFSNRAFIPFLSVKVLGASSFVLLNYAIKLGSVSIVNALRGAEYAFVFIMAFVFSSWFPGILKESFSVKATVQKILGVTFVCLGVVVLFIL